MEVLILGSGAGGLAGRRAQSSIVLREEGTVLLLDAGQPLPKRLYEESVDPQSISYVLVTHAHADHLFGLVGLLYDLATIGVRRAPPIYAGTFTVEKLRVLERHFFPKSIEAEIEIIEDFKEEQIELGSLVIETFPVKHTIPTLGVRVFSRKTGRCVFYSSDTAFLENLREKAECDVGIHEATIPVGMEDCSHEAGHHSSPRQALTVLEKSRVRVLTHISEYTFRDPFSYEKPYIVAFDGLRISL
uniref:MBL fold metallo-hydrolase n=1 Tax=Fervidicoccus fontis TaxID=683846 RepID=A0A7J3ZKP5_9CREN